MKLTAEQLEELARFPMPLRALVEAELTAGNAIVELGHGFPAPPVGAYLKLARPVSTRLRRSGDGLDFYERNSSSHAGEFTDAKRFFFVLEPPRPPEPEPDMDALRAARETAQRLADAARFQGQAKAPAPLRGDDSPAAALSSTRSSLSGQLVTRFRESMVIDYGKWREGIGYDLTLLAAASPEERAELESLLVTREVRDWRDVEALAALDTPQARALLRQTLATGSHELAEAVTRFAPELVSPAERTAALVAALAECDFFGGLTQALGQVASFHPPEIVAALLRGTLQREGGPACHFAAMLMFLHGHAKTPFDWELRPFFLRFNTPDPTEREAMFRELCNRIAVDPEPYLAAGTRP